MAPTLDAHHAEERARALLENRITSVRAVVTTRSTLDDLRAQVADAEVEDAKAYRAALADGWSADELRKLGIDEPAKTARVRRRSAARKSSEAAAQNSEDGNALQP